MAPAKRQNLTGIAFYDHELLIRGSIMHCDHEAPVFGTFQRRAARVAEADCPYIEPRADCRPNERHLGGRSVGVASRRIEQFNIIAEDCELQ